MKEFIDFLKDFIIHYDLRLFLGSVVLFFYSIFSLSYSVLHSLLIVLLYNSIFFGIKYILWILKSVYIENENEVEKE